jgi:hypothetical protein
MSVIVGLASSTIEISELQQLSVLFVLGRSLLSPWLATIVEGR